MTLHTQIIGQGKPLIILHGFLGMGDNWRSHALNIAKAGFEVHLIDQRNHGQSLHSEAFNYPLLVEDLKHYIEEHKIEKPHILGHSMGGKTAMLFAVTHPKLTDKLIIVDMSPKSFPAHHNAILKALNSVDFSIHNSRKLVDQKLSEYIPEAGIRGFLCKSLYWVAEGQLGFRFNIESLTAHYEEILIGLPQDTIFNGEALFLGGTKSDYITKEDIPMINAHFPNNKVLKIANAGHWVHAENPTGFFNELMKFIG